MTENKERDPNYTDDETGRLEIIWGEGFLSPGGPAEVSRVLENHNIEGFDILDIGSGTGGADIALVREHGAGTVVGIDVEKKLVDLANHYLTRHALENRIKYQLVDPGPLPFPDETFDAVFSKDAIIHVQDKYALYSEAFRVTRPGGRLFVSDWLRGEGDEFDSTVERFAEASGHDFTLVSLREIGEIVRKLGFVDIDLTDRRDWYLNEATTELEKMRGSLQTQLHEEIEFWEIMVDALNEGAIMPGHIRAMKPVDSK
jgi:phosphoethanolamine N-methyltransferase